MINDCGSPKFEQWLSKHPHEHASDVEWKDWFSAKPEPAKIIVLGPEAIREPKEMAREAVAILRECAEGA